MEASKASAKINNGVAYRRASGESENRGGMRHQHGESVISGISNESVKAINGGGWRRIGNGHGGEAKWRRRINGISGAMAISALVRNGGSVAGISGGSVSGKRRIMKSAASGAHKRRHSAAKA
jgi:hypothetical protein